MADEFDVVDVVFEAIKAADTGLIPYKDSSATGERRAHITVRSLIVNEKDYVNKANVNVNVFIPKIDRSGMMNRPDMMSVVRTVKKALREIRSPYGMYWDSRIVWSEPMGEAKEGFDCTNIRLEVITELD